MKRIDNKVVIFLKIIAILCLFVFISPLFIERFSIENGFGILCLFFIIPSIGIQLYLSEIKKEKENYFGKK